MPVSRISIANAALAEIAVDSIASFEEESEAARQTNRVFDNVVSDLLERSQWGFKTRRADAVEVTNDRPGEWNFAYAKPADAAKVLRVLPPTETDYPDWGQYDDPVWEQLGPIPFIEVNGLVYANIEDAILEYASTSVEVTAFPPMFRRAVETELAARVCYPLKKDRALLGDRIQIAELALARAIADDENRYPRRQTDYISEAELARAGYERGVVEV